MPSKAHITEVVIRQLQQLAPAGVTVHGGSHPIGDCGLQSADGVQVAVALEVELDITIPDDENPFVDDSGGRCRARSVSEIVDWLSEKSAAEAAK